MTSATDDASMDHAEQTIRSIVRLHARHHETAPWPQRAVGWLVERLGRPVFVMVSASAVAGWIVWNASAPSLGYAPVDPAPFPALQSALSVGSLFAVILVLAAQRHEDDLNAHRDLLSLELALLGEQKTAKVIQLIEELRRDIPQVQDRVDPAAERMSEPADPDVVIETIKQSDAIRARAP